MYNNWRQMKTRTDYWGMTKISTCSSLCPVSCCFMILWLSANSFFVNSQLDRVQLSKMQLGSWEAIKIHHLGLLCRDYNLEIVTKLLQWSSLAIPTLLKNCPFLSVKPQAWFAFLLEFSFVYNGKWSRELLVHLSLSSALKTRSIFGSCLVQLLIFSSGKGI